MPGIFYINKCEFSISNKKAVFARLYSTTSGSSLSPWFV